MAATKKYESDASYVHTHWIPTTQPSISQRMPMTHHFDQHRWFQDILLMNQQEEELAVVGVVSHFY